MPAVCIRAVTVAPTVMSITSTVSAANVRLFWIVQEKSEEICRVAMLQANFCGKHVPGNTETGTCFLEMDPEMRKRAHVILLSCKK